jgi:ribonucleoside-triphosphate reductase
MTHFNSLKLAQATAESNSPRQPSAWHSSVPPVNSGQPFDYGDLKVVKRNGRVVEFDEERIRLAITKAAAETKEFDKNEVQTLTEQVKKVIRHKTHNQVLSIESIQDIIEQVLINSNHFKTARAYIVYREKHQNMRRGGETLAGVLSFVEEYLEKTDWRVKANANSGYSLGGLILNLSGKVVANYWLNGVYSPLASQAHREGDFHIHDLDMLAGYCE